MKKLLVAIAVTLLAALAAADDSVGSADPFAQSTVPNAFATVKLSAIEPAAPTAAEQSFFAAISSTGAVDLDCGNDDADLSDVAVEDRCECAKQVRRVLCAGHAAILRTAPNLPVCTHGMLCVQVEESYIPYAQFHYCTMRSVPGLSILMLIFM